MKAIVFIYNKSKVEFQKSHNHVMINATQMAKIFNKKVENFTRLESTKVFIAECLKNANRRFLNIEEENQLINSKQKSGTYMHRVLALKFAAWLNPEFELWVFTTIDKLLYSHFKELKDATIVKLEVQKERDGLREELLRKHPEDFYRFLELENRLTEADKRRIKAIRNSTKELKLELFPEDITKELK